MAGQQLHGRHRHRGTTRDRLSTAGRARPDPDLAALVWSLPPELLRDNGLEKVAAVPARVKRSGDRWVLVPEETGEVAAVNVIGHEVFAQCDGSRSARDIARDIASETGEEIEHVDSDVTAFLDQLRAAALITNWRSRRRSRIRMAGQQQLVGSLRPDRQQQRGKPGTRVG
ncbi:MAG: PqqD family protein [Haloechinothrix sp.]